MNKPNYPVLPDLSDMDEETRDAFLRVYDNQIEALRRKHADLDLPPAPQLKGSQPPATIMRIVKWHRTECERTWNEKQQEKHGPKKRSRRDRRRESVPRSETSTASGATIERRPLGKDTEGTESEASESLNLLVPQTRETGRELQPGVLPLGDEEMEVPDLPLVAADPKEAIAAGLLEKYKMKVHPFLGSVALVVPPPPSIWDLVSNTYPGHILLNRMPDYSRPGYNQSPEGPCYVPDIPRGVEKPVRLLRFDRTQIQAEMNRFRTKDKDAYYRVKQAQVWPDDDEFLAEVCDEARHSGFIVVQTASLGYVVGFVTLSGNCIILTHKDKNIDFPKPLIKILIDPTIIKVGRNLLSTVTEIEKRTLNNQRVNGCYDLAWGAVDIGSPTLSGSEDDPQVSLTSAADRVDTQRYPRSSFLPERYANTNPYQEPWEKIHVEWKLGFIQTLRLTMYKAISQFANLGRLVYQGSTENLMPYTRLIFAALSMDRPVPYTEVSRRKLLATSRWLKEDPYYTIPKERAYPLEAKKAAVLTTEYQKWAVGIIPQRFQQWNRVRQYNYRCTQCDTLIQTTQEAKEHIGHCPLDSGIYGDGLYCEYPLCKAKTHTVLNCNLITAWCQHCERRGHLPYHHLSNDLVYLEDCYLSFECYNLKTGYKLLTAGRHIASKITDKMWRFSLYGHTPKELPKMLLQQPQLNIDVSITPPTPDEVRWESLRKLYYQKTGILDRQNRPGAEKLSGEAIKKLQLEIESIRREQERISAQQELDYAKEQEKARECNEESDFLKEQKGAELLSREEIQPDGRRFYYLLKGFATPDIVNTILQTHCLDNGGVRPIIVFVLSRISSEPRYAVYTFVRELDNNEAHPAVPEGTMEGLCFLEIRHLEPAQMETTEAEVAAGSQSPETTSGEEQEVQLEKSRSPVKLKIKVPPGTIRRRTTDQGSQAELDMSKLTVSSPPQPRPSMPVSISLKHVALQNPQPAPAGYTVTSLPSPPSKATTPTEEEQGESSSSSGEITAEDLQLLEDPKDQGGEGNIPQGDGHQSAPGEADYSSSSEDSDSSSSSSSSSSTDPLAFAHENLSSDSEEGRRRKRFRK